MTTSSLIGWERLRHGGLLLDAPRLQAIARLAPAPLAWHHEEELRRQASALLAGNAEAATFVSFVLERVCGFAPGSGTWLRGPTIGTEWNRRTPTGETAKPRQLWRGSNGAILPVFLDSEKHIGIGRGRRTASQVVQWLRAGTERLALLTNGRQWRLIFAGLDFDAFCEWDADLWFEEGQLSPQIHALRTLVSPETFTPTADGQAAPLLAAVLDSRKGQAELSAALGERVREAVELLVQAHGEALRERCADVDPADIYRAAVRIVMRMVVVLFAESRDLLPRDTTLYHGAYGIGGLLEELEKTAARGGNRLARSFSAWPRILALFRLVHQGSHHPALPAPAYGGELFAPSSEGDRDGLSRALRIFETAVFDNNTSIFNDREVHRLLEKISRTRVRLRQGRQTTSVTVPVDFSDLSSEYIGILYEGLLDFELKTAPSGDPVIFLAVGNQPALPLSRLETMDDRALSALLEKMKDTSSKDDEDSSDEDSAEVESDSETNNGIDNEEDVSDLADEADIADNNATDGADDHRHTTRTRAENWARRAVESGELTSRPRGTLTPEKRRAYEEAVARKARQLVIRVVLPGEWFLVRWGGTRKGSGTFYTRPGLAVPTVQRTLRPLAYTPPLKSDGTPNFDAHAREWTPRPPEEILALKICDPACGSGTFPVASLRYLTEALYAAVHHHNRLADRGDRSVVSLLSSHSAGADDVAALGQEMVPCRPDDPNFEPRLKAILKRHVVERCIYGVDLDPLAVELCRLSLWIETMDRSLPFSFLDHKVKCGNGLVGAWFDQFLHYPVMAWKNREGGDKSHSNGVHFTKEARGKALREFSSGALKNDLSLFLSGPTLFDPRDRAKEASNAHGGALSLLARLHELPVHDTAERARIYREELLGSPSWQGLKAAMDLWCACWFWPADAIEHAPLPSTFAMPSAETRIEATRIAARLRFFHWELEFPDVFGTAGAGFDAILGNPPWENLQPNPEEFFANYDPLFRTYGRLAKNARLKEMFTQDLQAERAWLDYSADFNSMSNWVTYAGNCFGDPSTRGVSNDGFPIARGKSNDILHSRWRNIRQQSKGYSDPDHPFRHQTGRIFTYRLFLEQSFALLRTGGRMGQIVPSGIYSDAWSQPLRMLFLDHCQWEWLFGFENRDGVFEIDSRFKFNPVIIQKGGSTSAIRTAFMRRKLEDWERADELVTPYTRAQVDQFSPRSQAILEIQSKRDLELLGKIYANSVLLGDDGPDGWGIKYKLEFMMNTDAHLFPPRPKWEEQGYRPDEYSRWLKGDWRPIVELWAELGIDPDRVKPSGVQLEQWLFDSSAGPERRTAEARFVHGHFLKPGDVARTAPLVRCAQPPYDKLPIPRADIPAGIILSREADEWIREERVADVALPLYEGRMVDLFDFSQKGWESGKGRSAKWPEIPSTNKVIIPQYLMSQTDYAETAANRCLKLGFLAIGSATNQRSLYCAVLPDLPCGNSVATLQPQGGHSALLGLVARLTAFTFDYIVRLRLTGINLNFFVIEEAALPRFSGTMPAELAAIALSLPSQSFAGAWIDYSLDSQVRPAWKGIWAVADSLRLQRRVIVEVLSAAEMNLAFEDLAFLLRDCDWPLGGIEASDPKGFWRVDKDKDPELRHTVLTLVAFHDLEAKIREHNGDRDAGIAAFLAQNNGEGWLLPETLRLADYGLGHDDRAKEHQPVASRLGPRFYDWQLAQTADESWRECHLHARNLLGEAGYNNLLADIEAERSGIKRAPPDNPQPVTPAPNKRQFNLFD